MDGMDIEVVDALEDVIVTLFKMDLKRELVVLKRLEKLLVAPISPRRSRNIVIVFYVCP